MLDALGLAGYEGIFRRVAETTMGVLRGNRDMLMSVLESFVHDPLVEWTKSRRHRDRGGACLRCRFQPSLCAWLRHVGACARSCSG